MDDALRRRLDACLTDDVEEQAEAVPELIALVEKLDAELDECRAVARQCYQWVRGQMIDMRTGQPYHKTYTWLDQQ